MLCRSFLLPRLMDNGHAFQMQAGTQCFTGQIGQVTFFEKVNLIFLLLLLSAYLLTFYVIIYKFYKLVMLSK